jgi:hypothetical protein
MTTPPTPPSPQRFGLRSQRLGCLPVVNFFLARLGLGEHLDAYLPHNDARLRLPPASVIRLVVATSRPGICRSTRWGTGRRPTTRRCSGSAPTTPRP